MKISVEVDSKINIPDCMKAVQDDAFWTFAAVEWHRLYSKYVPMDEGKLRDTVSFGVGEIEHTQPYARYQYYGNFNHSNSKNPLASARWDQAAKPTEEQKLINALQKYIDSRG